VASVLADLPMRHALPALLALGLLACTTPEEHRVAADRETYEIVRERREQLGEFDPFTIDPQTGTLRDRLLAGEQVEPLDLAEALVIASENSREYCDEREALFLEALDLTLERWNFGVQPVAGADAGAEGTADDASRQDVTTAASVSKLFTSGMAVVGNLALSSIRLIGSDSTSSAWSDFTAATLTITQPLLRGFGSDIVREPLTQAERNVLYQARSFERFRHTFAFDVTRGFFDVLEAVDTIQNEEENHRGLLLLRERNESFSEAGRLNEIEVDQARQDELEAQNRVILARSDLETRRDDFKLQLGLPVRSAVPLEPAEYLQLQTWGFLGLDLPEETVVEVALARRLDLMTQRELVEDAARRVYIAADGLRNGLDFAFAADHVSDENNAWDWQGDHVDWRVNMSFDLAIDRLPERNAYRESLVRLEQAKRAEEDLSDSIQAQLRQELRDLEAARQTYDIQGMSVELALRRVESTALSLEAGRANTRDVLESQESLVQARNNLTGATTAYILSGLALFRDMELLSVTETGIEVDVRPFTAADPTEPPTEDSPP